MAPPVRTPRSRWIEEGLRALAGGGPSAVRVDALAKGLGVTRGGFFGHFAGRDELLVAVLEEWERRSTDEVLTRVEARGGDAAARVLRAGAWTFSDELAPVDLAVRDWARHDAEVAERLSRVDERRMAYLRSLLSELHPDDDATAIDARALLAFSLALGVHLVAVDQREAVLRRALDQLLR